MFIKQRKAERSASAAPTAAHAAEIAVAAAADVQLKLIKNDIFIYKQYHPTDFVRRVISYFINSFTLSRYFSPAALPRS